MSEQAKLAEQPPFVGASGSALVLTVRQPWAWLILHAGKDIENRTWPTKLRGRVWIHAAKGMTVDEYWDARRFVSSIYDAARLGHISIPDGARLQRGGIIGAVDIVDCVSSSESPWFCGPWGFTLANPTPCELVPCRGALGFWRWSPNASPSATSNTEASHGS